MPFELTNAPATFMTLMNSVLRLYLGKFAVVFLDDILIYSKMKKKHIEHQSEFFAKEVKYLGHYFPRRNSYGSRKSKAYFRMATSN